MKKARVEVQDLLYVGLVLVITGIVLAFSADITSDIREDFLTGEAFCNATSDVACDTNYNITTNSLEGTSNLAERFGTVGTIAAIVVVVGLLMTGFGVYMRR